MSGRRVLVFLCIVHGFTAKHWFTSSPRRGHLLEGLIDVRDLLGEYRVNAPSGVAAVAGSGRDNVAALLPEVPVERARLGYLVRAQILQVILPPHRGPTE